MNRTIPKLLSGKKCRSFLFIFALAAAAASACPAMADTIFIATNHAYHNVAILSETKDSVTIKLRDNRIVEAPRSEVTGILKPGAKVYACRNDWTSFTAYFKGSDESVYRFSRGPDGAGEFTVSSDDIFFIYDKAPDERTFPVSLQLDTFSLILTAGFFQGIFLALMLFRRKKGNLRANRTLSLFIIIVSIPLSGGTLEHYLYAFPYLTTAFLALLNSCIVLIGPLLYFYVLTLTRPTFKPSIKHSLHLLPACAMSILFLYNAAMMNGEQLIILYNHSSFFHVSPQRYFLFILQGIQPCVYVLLSTRFLARHRRRIQDIFSSMEKINLSWLSYILRFMLVASAVWFAANLAANITLFNFSIDRFSFLMLNVWKNCNYGAGVLLTLLLFAIGYRGLAQPEIFAGIPNDLVEEPDGPEQKISMPPEKIREIMDRINKVMEEDRPYLDPGLTLPMLADMAGVSRNLLSQAINEHTKQNFYDFVNFYRVETVKEQMKNPAKREMNMLNLALEAGFNSKATFNSVFKKNTGITPTAYRKTILDN